MCHLHFGVIFILVSGLLVGYLGYYCLDLVVVLELLKCL